MSRPDFVGPFAEELYETLLPLAFADEENDWHVLHYCNALSVRYQKIDDIVRDRDEGPGWSILFDPDLAPNEGLPWLAQFTGVDIGLKHPSQLDQEYYDRARERIKDNRHFRRGSRQGMTDALKEALTGTQTVLFTERDGDPYFFTVSTLTAETPNPALAEAVAREFKPAGLIMTYQVINGQDYNTLKTSHASYTAVAAAYTDYNDIIF